jgi:multidrug efflux pump subunit AcrA (membrane-fusion protein)
MMSDENRIAEPVEPAVVMAKTRALAPYKAPKMAGPIIDAKPVSDSIWRQSLAGWSIIALFFGGFGYWAATAPLNGAVVAQAVVKVEGNRKSVQHLDGGIVKEMRIKEGDRMKAGDVLIVLDDSQARAEFQVFTQQHLVLRATEERLKAELARAAAMAMPADLAARVADVDVKGVWEGQVSQFESRRVSLEGQRKVIKERIAQLEHQIVGIEAQLKAYQAQLASVRKELDSYRPLVEKGLITLARFSQVERQGQAIGRGGRQYRQGAPANCRANPANRAGRERAHDRGHARSARHPGQAPRSDPQARQCPRRADPHRDSFALCWARGRPRGLLRGRRHRPGREDPRRGA